MAALDIGPEDVVVTTPFTFFATVSSILRCGATPLLADIDPATFNLSAEAVEAVLKSHPEVKAILPVHIFGYPADMPAFERIAQKHGLAIVEDADLDEAQERQLARALGQQYALITRDDRLEAVAKDIVGHFLGRGFPGKALVVSIDKVTAVRTEQPGRSHFSKRIGKPSLRRRGRRRPRHLRAAQVGHHAFARHPA